MIDQQNKMQPTTNNTFSLPGWGVKGVLRLSQLKKPGVYPVALVVNEDGRRELIVDNGKREMLGGNQVKYKCLPVESGEPEADQGQAPEDSISFVVE